jgi:CheY-like chemotaxis protein
VTALTASEPTLPDDPVPVLLVDDQTRNLDTLELTLAFSGCQLVRAQSGEEALLALLNADFAAIVLDIMMPGMNGLELARLIKSRRRTRHIPILFLTAHMIEQKDVLGGYEAGAVDYLTKPINPEILKSKLAVFVDLFRKTRALAKANEALQSEIRVREQAQEALRRVNNELEARVSARTAELTRANEALREADARKDEFLATLAHELRNPLAPVMTALEVLRHEQATSTARGEALQVIGRQVRQMARHIDDLMDISRIGGGKLVLRTERVELAAVVARAVETSRPIIDQRRHRLALSQPQQPVFVQGDLMRLAQVLSNLLNNAAKYTAPGGEIRFVVERHETEAVLHIIDTGVGIETEMLSCIFDLFVQGKQSRDMGGGGLGIGLTLARQLVELHGGRIQALSDGPGTGSEFIVRLPALVEAPEALAEPGDDGRIGRHGNCSLKVLIVDDNEDAADMLDVLLRGHGHQTRVAHGGEEAVSAAADFRPDVVLLDIGLPQMDGLAVARALRKNSWGADIVIVAVTGWGDEADRRRSAQAGFDRHLVKPIDPEELLSWLANLDGSAQPARPVPG